MRDSIRRSLARGSLIAVTLIVTGVFSGTALSSSATRSSEGETVISAVEQQRFVATKLELTTVPQIKRYLRSLGVNPTGVVVQRGPMNYAGPNCPGLAWNCTTATRVIQLSASGVAAAANRFVCRRDSGAGTADPANTPPEQSCVIVQPGGASNSATCDMDTTGAAGLVSQTCLITQGGASNTAVAKLAATLTGPGTEQDVRQRIEIKQTGGGTSGNTLRATQNARLRMNFGSGGALAAKQDFNQVVCANQQAAGSGSNTATVTQKGDSLAQARNRGDVTVLQNTEGRASTCLPTGPAAPFADFSGTGHDPTLCPVLGEISDDPKENANICARVQQDSVNGRNRITQDQHALVNGVIDRVGKVDLNQGSAEGGVDSTQDQRSTNLSTIADTQRSEQLSSVAQAAGPVNMTQVEDPRCCAAGHQLGNTGNTWKLRQTLRQRGFVNKVLVNPETFEGGEIEQTGSNQGNCTTSGTPPAGCTVEQDLTNNVESETNSCGPASSCDVIIECSATSESSSCTTEEDVTLSNTATVSSTTPDPNPDNNSDTETTTVSGAPPDALLARRGFWSLSPSVMTPAAQDPSPPPITIESATPPNVIIDNGSLVQLGLHPEGHLNVDGGSPSLEVGTTFVGVRYLPTDGEATAPGCLCEGWGIANADEATGTFTGHANADDGIFDLTVDPATGLYGTDDSIDPDSGGTRFRAITTTADRIKVTQDYHPSTSPNLYEVLVTLENIGATPIGDVRYRRVMDWDVPPTTFSEFSEIHVGTSTALVQATSDGFLPANPLDTTPPSAGAPPTTLHSGDPDYTGGPADQGSSFDFKFGSLAAGQQKTFRIFYGAAGDRAGALASIAAVGGEIYSLGMPTNDAGGADTDGPNVFVFAFAGVGGEPVGDISLAPLTAENQVGEDHTVTATLDDDGAPISGKVVTFTVVSGPNAGVTGTDTSDANGEATFTYTSSLTGTDQIEARFVDDSENIHTSNRVEKTWVAAPASADLSVDKSDSPDPVAEGEELTYTITISNSGPDAAQAVTLTDVLPESVTFNSAEASQGSCTGTSTVTCNLGTIANGASAIVTITVTP